MVCSPFSDMVILNRNAERARDVQLSHHLRHTAPLGSVTNSRNPIRRHVTMCDRGRGEDEGRNDLARCASMTYRLNKDSRLLCFRLRFDYLLGVLGPLPAAEPRLGRLLPSRSFLLRKRIDRLHRTRAPTHPFLAASRASPGPLPFEDRLASNRSHQLPRCRARVRHRSR